MAPSVQDNRSASPQSDKGTKTKAPQITTSSPAFPFPLSADIASVAGTSNLTGQALVEQTAYALSKALFSYSPESFDLDRAVKTWNAKDQTNGAGKVPYFVELESRVGAAAILLGYIYNQTGSNAPSGAQSVLASSATLKLMAPVLATYSAKPTASSPLAFNIAAVDYDHDAEQLVTDYSSVFEVARSIGLGLVSSTKPSEAQNMTVLATLLSIANPTVHVYDGLHFLRQTSRVSDIKATKAVYDLYSSLVDSSNASVAAVLDNFNAAVGTSYKAFEYEGAADAKQVYVVFGSAEAEAAREILPKSAGLIVVRIYSPFLEAEFLKTLPKTTESITVVGQVQNSVAVESAYEHSLLFADVSGAIAFSADFGRVKVHEVKYARSLEIDGLSLGDLLGIETTPKPHYTFFNLDNAATANTAAATAHVLALDKAAVTYYSEYDNYTAGGVVKTTISTDRAIPKSLTVVSDLSIVRSLNVTAPETDLLLVGSSKQEDLDKALTDSFKLSVALSGAAVHIVDPSIVGDNAETSGRTESMIEQLAFWKLAHPELSLDQITTKIVQANGVDTELVASTVAKLAETVYESALTEINTEGWGTVEGETELEVPPYFTVNAFGPANVRGEDEEGGAAAASISEAAKRVVFKEAYGTENSLRPDISTKNFVVKVQEKRRVTPENYDRNIFHVEFDITGTGLKYEIGEALGVHARNNAELVDQFIESYGLNPNELVSIRNSEDSSLSETRTVLQICREHLDLFGKPPKRFYEALAPFATDAAEKAALEKIASPAGAEELKKRSEVDTDSFVDILAEFPSARPTIADLVQIVAPLKRREYSIASSQKVHPNAVHLLIVVVDWVDPKGRKRFGQASKYINDLKVGEELVVSVKPSVMKLPPLTTQPIIMSGLGTGLAPFKAFVEEKAWQREQGHEIGDVYLYLGSRHKREEYLYGELWEAYKDAGVITHIGAAFSRDQPQKIYIQDRIRQSMPDLVDAFVKKEGGFYLCGPTWPVPDVTQVLSEIIETEAEERGEKLDSARAIEELKDAGRYVLEVY
ncbi:Subunit alpha of assimilatory sulfite reductase, putative [Yarrowia lipolytica]|nr:Subunit alpha of assimilatory sulfite reductase, putative [Yarrowia lipolytica]